MIDARSAYTLQPDGLPHQQRFYVGCRNLIRSCSDARSLTALPVLAEVLVVQVGSTMIKSPGAAASIAAWMVWLALTCMGALPPMVTVTASTDCLPLLGGDNQLTALRSRPTVLRLLLDRAVRNAGRHLDSHRVLFQAVIAALIGLPVESLPRATLAPLQHAPCEELCAGAKAIVAGDGFSN